MEPILEVSNVSFHTVFENFSLAIQKRSFTVLSGSNMCGKTTLIKILAGIVPTHEKVLLERCYLESLPKEVLYKKLAVVFSSKAHLSFVFNKVEDEILFALENLGVKENEKNERLEQVLAKFSLLSYRNISPKKLSRYQAVKLHIALAVLSSPKVLLLDDPCASLEKREAKQIVAYLEMLKEEGMTIFMTTSHLEDACSCDRLLILHKKEILLDGDPSTVFKEDGLLNKIGLELPFLVDLSIKLQYYGLVNQIYLNQEALVDALWK